MRITCLLLFVCCINAFMLIKPEITKGSRLYVSSMDTADQLVYRGRAFLWFFGSQGAATVGLGAIPGMKKNVDLIQSLKDEGPTKGGVGIGISPLCGYPRDLARADVEQIVMNPLSVEEIVKKYPVPQVFLSTKGYLTYQAFRDANSMANPLTVRAVFDSLGQGTNVVDPKLAQIQLDSYRNDLTQFNTQLLKSKATGWAAISVLFSLLGYAYSEAFSSAYKGFFPDWDPSKGVAAIPTYWHW
mmetsp:Transcript_21077/g.27320  ORF Transcript_21077/g.27320 Transcript_21077/m.27320 type:complete len:243 (-) Transcript_21077:97-825(-)